MPNHAGFDPSRRSLLLAGAAGGALASLGTIVAPPSSLAAGSSEGPIFHTQNEGIRPDHKGAADALVALMARAPSGSVILFEPGRYELERWPGFILSKSITLLAHPHTVTLHGPGIGKRKGNGKKHSFVTIAGTSVKGLIHISIEGLSFEKWGRTISAILSSPIESLSVRRCSFNSVRSAVAASMVEPKANGRINHVTVEDCEVRNVTGSAISVRALFRSAYILRNRISDGGREGIALGGTVPPNRIYEDQWKKAVVSHNVCTNLLNPKEGTDIHGIIVAGREIIVTHNHIEKVENGGGIGAEGIYAKARYADISHNTLVDAGLKEAAITLKGRPRVSKNKKTPGGFANRICNNSIISRRQKPRGRGIFTINGDTLIANNYMENLETGIRTMSRQNNDQLLITGNLIRGAGRGGIYHAGSGSNIAVIGNSISLIKRVNQMGIMLKPLIREGEVPTDWVVKDNSIQGEPAEELLTCGIMVYCKESEQQALDGLVISNNQFSDLQVGIWSKRGHSPKFPRNGAWIHGNYFRQCKQDVSAVLSEDGENVIVENNLSR